MKPIVSIIMGSTSDLPIMEKAATFFDSTEIPFEMLALSAHRTPREVEQFASSAKERGIKVIIAGAGMAAHLGGVIASLTTLPVIGVPIRSSFDGIPVATVGVNGALNAAILAAEILAVGDEKIDRRVAEYKSSLTDKIVKANEELGKIEYKFKC